MASAQPILITPTFVFAYPLSPNVNDYRCVVNASGDAVIVERTVLNADGGGAPQLYIVDLASRSATPFLKSLNAIPTGETTRPDWCWQTGQVAFNYSEAPGVGVVGATGVNPRLFPNTTTMYYPTWFPDGDTLATESGQGSPNPNTTTFDPRTGTIIAHALEGSNLFGGMPSVNPANPNLIAFAGQPVGSSYDQDMNYIWVKDISSSDPAVTLEYNAPAAGGYCPAFQGRAPWWSPDGKWVVFESNRGCVPSHTRPNGMYAIYLYEYGVPNPAFAITDWGYNCNHAKWFPNGFPEGPAGPFQLIVAAWQNGGTNQPSEPYGLAILDLAPLGVTF
jgi:Tol biopolymer transport system component